MMAKRSHSVAPPIASALLVLSTIQVLACPICDHEVTIDGARAACFLDQVGSLKVAVGEPIVVNFLACSDEVLRKGIVDGLGPTNSKAAAPPPAAELDDVAFLTRPDIDCLETKLKAGVAAPEDAIALDCSAP